MARKNKYGIVISLVVGLVVSLGYLLGVFNHIQNLGSDFLRVNFTLPPERKSVVYLLITDQTLIEADEVDNIQWPWPRQAYAEAVRFLKEAGAAAVVFDMIFTETSSYGQGDDEAFAEGIREGEVILGTLSTAKKGNTSRQKIGENRQLMAPFRLNVEDKGFEPTIREFPYFRPPVPVLTDAADRLGDVKFSQSEDGVGRRAGLLIRQGDHYYPSLALAAAMEALGADRVTLADREVVVHAPGGDKVIPVDSDGQAWLKYYGDSWVYPKYLLLRLIKSQIKIYQGEEPYYGHDLFRDKVVIIGTDATDLKDLRPNPFNKKNDPGVHYHGTAADNILNADFLKSYYSWVYVVPLVLGLATLVGFVSPRLSAGKSFGFVFLLVLLHLGSSVYLYRYHNMLIDIPTVFTAIVAAYLLTTLASYLVEAQQKTFVTAAFGQYLSPKVVQELVRNPDKLKLGGERREMTAFFSDVAGFSTISESMTPEELVALLNDYLTEMCDIIGKYEGTVDKFEGDAIIAFWGAPIETDKHAELACSAAIEMNERLKTLRERWKEEGRPELRVRMGLNTGPMVVGNMGSRSRMDYTMMGDAVNLASRLEGANKFYGTYIMVSETTWEQVKDKFEGRELDLLRVVGKNEPVRVFELLGFKGAVSAETTAMVKEYLAALQKYRDGAFDQARELFSRITLNGVADPVSREYAERCKTLINNPPPDDWDGVYTLTSKG